MLVLSIDVGIKNLAYCIIETSSNNSFSIMKWDVINLCDEAPTCGAIVKNTICNKKASYKINHLCFCKTHAKKSQYLLPDKATNAQSLRKLNIQELKDISKKYTIDISNIKQNKTAMLAVILPAIKEITLENVKKTSAALVGLVDIGIAIEKELDKHIPLGGIQHIIIENQLSPLASRMKTIQGMLAQYFIMRDKKHIVFVSAANKLRPFMKGITKKPSYVERKAIGIKYTRAILSNSPFHNRWLSLVTSHIKKDDLADSFLQGLWYLNYQKYLNDSLFEGAFSHVINGE